MTTHLKALRRGFSLIGTLAAVAIICILMVVLLKGYGLNAMTPSGSLSARPDAKGTTTMGLARLDAEDVVCRTNLSSVRQSVAAYELSNDGHFPASLDDLKLGADMTSCPIGHERYQYDPATGQVRCVHPGHFKY